MCGGSYSQPQASVNTPAVPVSEITAGSPTVTPAAPGSTSSGQPPKPGSTPNTLGM